MKKLKYIIAITLILIFTISIFAPAMAQGNTPFSQEKAIEKVKNIFDTSIYDRFNINYNEGKDRKVWDFSWSKSKEPYGSLNVTIDADKGNILSLYMYKGYDPDKKPSFLPKLTEEDARKAAEEFAKKLQPEEFAKTQYRKREEPEYYPVGTIRYREVYYFNFVRVEKDIPVESDGFNINVDANTGEIRNYKFNWSYDKLPSPDKILSKEEAEKIFKDKVGLKLVYQRYFDYQTKEDTVKLVYTVDGPYRVLIDAASGELINEGFYQPYYGDYGGAGGREMAQKSAELTPQEQKEVEATKNCISKDTAVKVVEKYLKIPDGYEQNYANLYEDYDNPEKKVWNINWDKKSKTPGDYGSINARVDAVSSELLGFNIYDDSRYRGEFKQNYDRAAAQKKAEEFLKKIQPERFNNVKLEEIKGNIKTPEIIREHYYNFTRQVNGIPYPANGFNVTIDAASGQVISYDMRWQEREFPKADGILSKDEAESFFLKDYGLELAYVKVYSSDAQTDKYYLAYKLKTTQSYTFDAKDFKPLDYRGEPIEKKPETCFTDIKGHWAEKDIQLLVDLGVIQSAEENFLPDQNISQGEFIKLLMIATNRRPAVDEIALKYGMKFATKDSDSKDDIQKYIEAAIKAGIVKNGEIEAEKPLAREKMAAFLIRSLGFEKVASIPGIYNVPAKDAASISPDYRGHAAIAMGLKLISGSAGNFNPQGSVTRAQTATVLVRMLSVEK